MKAFFQAALCIDLYLALTSGVQSDEMYRLIWVVIWLGCWILCKVNDNHRLLEELLEKEEKE